MTTPPPAVVAVPVKDELPPFVRHLHSPRMFTAAGVAAAVIGLGFALRLKSATGLLIGAYALAWFYSLRLATLAIARRFVPGASGISLDLPITARHALRGKAAWVAPLALLGLLTVTREGAFAPDVLFDVSLQRFNTDHHWTSNNTYNWQTAGIGRTFLRGLPVRCDMPSAAGPAADIVTGFNGYVTCDRTARGESGVTVTFALQTKDAWCYAPLIKTATIPYTLNVTVTGVVREGNGVFTGNGHIAINGQLSQSMYGIASCRAFNNAAGRRIAMDAIGVLNAFLREN